MTHLTSALTENADDALDLLLLVCSGEMKNAHKFALSASEEAEVDALLSELYSTVRDYIDAHEDDPMLYRAVESWLIEIRSPVGYFRIGVIDAARSFFAARLDPAFIKIGSEVCFNHENDGFEMSVADRIKKYRDREPLMRRMRDVLAAEQQRIGDQNFPVEIIRGLISERVDKGVKKVIEQ